MTLSTHRICMDSDNNPKLFCYQELSCRSKKCSNYNTVVKRLLTPLESEIATEEEVKELLDEDVEETTVEETTTE